MKLQFLAKSRGLGNLISRIFTVSNRFGISPKKFEQHLKTFYDITRSGKCLPTFAITAVVLARHPGYIRELSRRGVEFAVHGYIHIDYQISDKEESRNHFKKAMDTFNTCQIPAVGFRAPFLRENRDTDHVLSDLGFMYNSTRVLYWPVPDTDKLPRHAINNVNNLLEFYRPLEAEKYLSLPGSENGLVVIPVSIPDDEMIVERMGITDEKKIGDIWLDIMAKIHERGELFVLSLHPERIEHCESGLKELLKKAGELSPPVWVATLKDIAEWWHEKAKFTFDIQSQGDGRYRVRAECSERATVLVKNAEIQDGAEPWYDGYKCVSSRDFLLESNCRPVIGMAAGSSMAVVKFLQEEGYILDLDSKPRDCGVYLDNLQQFGEVDKKALLQRIERSNAALLRYWRWPNRARSALSVTGDIDSITISDFVLRIIENKLKNI